MTRVGMFPEEFKVSALHCSLFHIFFFGIAHFLFIRLLFGAPAILTQAIGRPSCCCFVVSLFLPLVAASLSVNNSVNNSVISCLQELNRIPWRGPGCTGIIATNSEDGTVNHARNLDFRCINLTSP